MRTARRAVASPCRTYCVPTCSDVLLILVAAAFVMLLFAGRRELVESAGAKVANGVLMLVLATLAGVITVELLASLVSL